MCTYITKCESTNQHNQQVIDTDIIVKYFSNALYSRYLPPINKKCSIKKKSCKYHINN